MNVHLSHEQLAETLRRHGYDPSETDVLGVRYTAREGSPYPKVTVLVPGAKLIVPDDVWSVAAVSDTEAHERILQLRD